MGVPHVSDGVFGSVPTAIRNLGHAPLVSFTQGLQPVRTQVESSAASRPRFASPAASTPKHLAEKILASKTALEGERKHVTVLFADLKGSMELLADRDPEEARRLLDPVLERMMEAVSRVGCRQWGGDGHQVQMPLDTARAGTLDQRRVSQRSGLRPPASPWGADTTENGALRLLRPTLGHDVLVHAEEVRWIVLPFEGA
jgi:class 3 adenylate cyclase